MARDDEREAERLEQAAADTREPAVAARIRADDDASTRERQDATGANIDEAARALADNERRLRETREALQAMQGDVRATREVARDVAENAEVLREQTHQAAEQVRAVPARPVDDAQPRG